jgi:hypothetical protein
MKTPRKRRKGKVRNRLAMNAWARSGAGVHRDRKREAKIKPVKEDTDY